jgi:hypothetical protein
MDLGTAMIARAEAAIAITDIAGTRIHWVKRPQGEALPALVFSGVGGIEDVPLTDEADYFERRVQADCLADTHAEAWALARAVRATFKDGATIGDDPDTFDFMDCDISLPIDLGEDTPQGFVHRAGLDMVVRHGAES